MEDANIDQYTYEHLPQAVALLDSDEWLQLFHPPVYPSEHEEIQKLRLAVSTVLTALSALRKSVWVRSTDRLPTHKDAYLNEKVIAKGMDNRVVMAYYAHVRDFPNLYILWAPIPPLPEVEE